MKSTDRAIVASDDDQRRAGGHDRQDVRWRAQRVLLEQERGQTTYVGRRSRSSPEVHHPSAHRRGRRPPIGSEYVQVAAAVRMADELIGGGRTIRTQSRGTCGGCAPGNRPDIRVVDPTYRDLSLIHI